MASIKIEMDSVELEKLIVRFFQDKLGDVDLELEDITIEVKSKQNYRSEWEKAAFRASICKVL